MNFFNQLVFLPDSSDDEYKKMLKAMSVSEEEIDELAVSRKELCKRHEARLAGKGRESESEWIDSFADSYQTKLDYIAKERIKYYSYRGGLAATVSHVSAMDRFVILSAMFGLANDLIAIYNLKPSRIKFNHFTLKDNYQWFLCWVCSRCS